GGPTSLTARCATSTSTSRTSSGSVPLRSTAGCGSPAAPASRPRPPSASSPRARGTHFEPKEAEMAAFEYTQIVQEGLDSDERMVDVERAAGYAIVTLDDPDKVNVLSAALMVQLRTAVEDLVADEDIRAIVLTGAGHGFSTGGDLRLME